MSEPADLRVLLDQLAHGATDNPDAEWQAAIALGKVQLPEEKDQAVMALLAALTGGRAHALTRAHAVESLGKLGDRRAAPALIAALKDPYRLTRAYAAGTLGELGDSQATDPLLASLGADEFFGARAEAAAAAARLGVKQDTATRQHVRDTLTQRRAAEMARPEPGSERVIAEIDRALQLLESKEA